MSQLSQQDFVHWRMFKKDSTGEGLGALGLMPSCSAVDKEVRQSNFEFGLAVVKSTGFEYHQVSIVNCHLHLILLCFQQPLLYKSHQCGGRHISLG